MALSKINPTNTLAWKNLEAHFNSFSEIHMKNLFAQDQDRANTFTVKWEDFYLDYSKNRISQETINLLLQLANEVKLKEAIQACFSGETINQTEQRAVLHTALRAKNTADIKVDGKNIMPEIVNAKQKIKEFSEAIITGSKKGYTGKAFTHIVNIGIGGSDLGPAMVTSSLQYYKNHLTTYFVSNVDGDHVSEVLNKLDPETTLFIIVSKTFTTQETITNATTLKKWFLQHATQKDIAKHFVAVSTNVEKAKQFGVDANNIFPMWNWVGGRFSLWSAVGLSISLALGNDNFEKLLLGANKMDTHFKNEPFEKNIPVLLALISVWYTNFFKAESEAIIPYSQYLNAFTSYLQQAKMESNGKNVDRNQEPIKYQTGSIVWGAPGTNAQHAFFQLMHQGTKLIPADFIGFAKSLHDKKEHHIKLMANFFAQTEALLQGNETSQNLQEPFKVFKGNNPTNTILIHKLTPESLGKLIAMYEHKIFVQGVIWNIYSFDQFGVELGKQLAGNILDQFKKGVFVNHDASTLNLLKYFNDLTK
ncbi:MAG: glucose-6-phosphate isomerase [Oceanihabitans sp.]